MNDETVLLIDVGNTSAGLGWYCRGSIERQKRLDRPEAFSPASRARALEAVAGVVPADAAVIASVVPSVTDGWRDSLRRFVSGPVLEAGPQLDIGIPIDYPFPESIGADRLANACGAVERYGSPVIVADFGTALTFDVVDRRRGYIGGAIAPGLPLMFDYLADRTELLPHVIRGDISHAIGRSTEEAIRSGARWGYLGMVREILRRIQGELGQPRAALCATGGFAGWVLAGEIPDMHIDPDLTLYGLACIGERNLS